MDTLSCIHGVSLPPKQSYVVSIETEYSYVLSLLCLVMVMCFKLLGIEMHVPSNVFVLYKICV